MPSEKADPRVPSPRRLGALFLSAAGDGLAACMRFNGAWRLWGRHAHAAQGFGTRSLGAAAGLDQSAHDGHADWGDGAAVVMLGVSPVDDLAMAACQRPFRAVGLTPCTSSPPQRSLSTLTPRANVLPCIYRSQGYPPSPRATPSGVISTCRCCSDWCPCRRSLPLVSHATTTTPPYMPVTRSPGQTLVCKPTVCSQDPLHRC